MPTVAPTMPPASSTVPSLKSSVPRLKCDSAPENEEAMTWLAPVATAIAGGNVVEDQQRRDEEAAADTEHAGEEPDRSAHGEQYEEVYRQFCDRQINTHPRHIPK